MSGTGALGFTNPILDAANQGRLVTFVGAGVSMISPTCMPSWWDVNERVVVALSQEAESLVGLDQAAALVKAVRDRQQADRFPPEYQAELIARRIGTSYFRVLQCLDSDRPNAVHLRLARLGLAGKLAAIVTTNFDRALEAAFRSVGCPLRSCSRADEFEGLAPDLEQGGGRVDECVLLKLHGSAEDPTTLIDTLAQRKRGLPRGALACLRTLLNTAHWIFLGWSGADLDADEGYLGLKPACGHAQGFTWLYRCAERPRTSVSRVRDAYGERAVIVHGELPDWLATTTAPLIPPDPPLLDSTDADERQRLARDQIAVYAREWAGDLGPTLCALCFADILVAVGEPQAAINLLRKAREALPAAERGDKDDIMLACALADELGKTGDDAQALDLYHNAIASLEARGDYDRAAEARCNAGLLYWTRGDLKAASAAFAAALAITYRSGDEGKRSVALHNMAMIEGHLGHFDRADLLFREEIEILGRLGDEPNAAVALNDLGEMLGKASRFDSAVEILSEAVRIRERLGNDRGRAMSLGNLAQVHFRRGDLQSAAKIYCDLIDIFGRLSDEPNRLKTVGNLGVVVVRQGRPDEAIPLLREAISHAETMGREPELARLLMNLGEALREAEDPAEALAVLLKSVDIWERLGVLPERAETLLEVGVTHLKLKQLDDAERVFRETLGIWESLRHEPAVARVLSNLGLVAQQRGNLDEAFALFERSNEVAARLGERAGLVRGKLNVGNIALQQGRLDEALNAYAVALEIADQLPLPLEAAGARSAIAYTLGLQGKIGAAIAAFRDAEAHITNSAAFLGLAERLEHLAEVYAANGHDHPASICASEATRLRHTAQQPSAVDVAGLRSATRLNPTVGPRNGKNSNG